LWILVILWIASRPKTAFFPTGMKTILGLPREFVQYPYHFGAFFILAVLFRRYLSRTEKAGKNWRAATFSLIGCAVVSIVSEVLQIYVPSRTPALRDLAVDQSGATFAVTLMRRFGTKLFRLE
jgi:VanZ family protein